MTQTSSPLAWGMWALAACFYLFQFLLRVSPSIMTQELMETFNVSGCGLGELMATYYLAYALMQIPIGLLLDHFGPRKIMAASCLFASLGTFVFAQSTALWEAELARFFIGVGSAAGFIGTLKLATLFFPKKYISRITALTLMLGTLGASFGSAPLSALVKVHQWRMCLDGLAVFGIFLAFALALFLKEAPMHTHPQDTDQKISQFFKGFIDILFSPQIWLLAVFGCLMYVPLSAVADLWGTPFLKAKYGLSDTHAGAMTSFIYYGVAAGALGVIYVSAKLESRRYPMMLGALMMLMFLSLVFYSSVPEVLMMTLLFGVGVSFGGQNLIFVTAAEQVPTRYTGVTFGFLNTIVMMSGAVFQRLIGKLLDWTHSHAQGEGFTAQDFEVAFIPIPLAAFTAFCLVKFIHETYHAKH